MKKAKLLLISIASIFGVSSVVACTPGGSSIVSSIDPNTATGSLAVKITTPEEDVLVGDEINLDDYVTIEGLHDPKSYTAELTTPETAELNGHTLVVLKAGSVGVKITATSTAGSKKTGRFVVNALSQTQSSLKSFLDGVTTNYFMQSITVSKKGIELVDGGTLHNENYFATLIDYDDQGNYTPESEWYYDGLMRSGNGKTHSFTMKDLAGNGLEVAPGDLSDLSMYFLAQDFPLRATDFTTVSEEDEVTGEVYESLECTNQSVINEFCKIVFGYYGPQEMGYAGAVLYCEMTPVEYADGTKDSLPLFYIVFEYQGQPTLFVGGLMDRSEASYTCPGLEAYREAKTEPEPIKVDEVAPAAEKYALAASYTEHVKMGYFNAKGEEVAIPEDATLPVVEATTTADADAVVSTITETDGVESLTYVFASKNEVGAVLYEYAEDALTPLGEKVVFDGNPADIISAQASTFVAIDRTEIEGGVEFAMLGGNCPEFALAVLSTIPNYGEGFVNMFSQAYTDGSGYLYEAINGIVTITEEAVVYDFYVVWSQGVYYHMTFTFSGLDATIVDPAVKALLAA